MEVLVEQGAMEALDHGRRQPEQPLLFGQQVVAGSYAAHLARREVDISRARWTVQAHQQGQGRSRAGLYEAASVLLERSARTFAPR